MKREPPPPKLSQAASSSWWRALTSPEGLVVGSVLLSFTILWPVGSYAVDDEWAFLKSLQHLDLDRRLVILQWNPMSLVGHLFWGALFTAPFGFSFIGARLSTVALFVLLELSVAALLRNMGVSRRATLFVLFALLFNPLSFFHGFLYVTDIPACAWTCLGLLLITKGLGGDAPRHHWAIIAGSACGAFGFLLRQSGLLIHIALLSYLILYDRRRLGMWSSLAACLVLPGVTAAAFQYWYYHVHGPTTMYVQERLQILQALRHPNFRQVFLNAFKYGIYIGLFTLPVLVALPTSFWGRLTKARLAIVAGVACLCAILVAFLANRQHVIFPYLPNKLTPFGFLSPNEIILGNRPVLWGTHLAWAVTILLAIALVGFIGVAVERGPGRATGAPLATLRLTTLLGLLQFVYLLVTAPIVFDRHLLMLLPTTLILVSGWTRDCIVNRVLPGFVLILLAVYSLACTHDVHAVSRAAFVAGDSVKARGESYMSIDGGYAFDGWYSFEAWQQEKIDRARTSDPWWVRTLVQGIDTRIMLSLSPSLDESTYRDSLRPWAIPAPNIEGYRVVGTFPYTTWLPPAHREGYVLTRP